MSDGEPLARLQCLKCGRWWISRSDVTRDQWIALQRDFATHICGSDVEIRSHDA